mmetsp:Transcript_100970/g.325948  ORF Transcript_100970/g.325948 Transcript_100970/m.325948 type:complete len:244 (+) Transcript_100970:1202-1933(+)
MTCISRVTSPSWAMTAALECKPDPAPSPSAVEAAPCARSSAVLASICRPSSARRSAQLAEMSPRSSARAPATSLRSPAVADSRREASSARSSAPRPRRRVDSSVASRPRAAERSERSAPASALVRPCELSMEASPAIAACMLRAESARAARSFSTSAIRSLLSALSSSRRSDRLIWCRSASFLRASRSVSSASTRQPSRTSSSPIELCRVSGAALSTTSASVRLSCCRSSSTSVLRALHSASR